jgi:hypothetical protein
VLKASAQEAGYHGDTRTFTRLLIDRGNLVSYEEMHRQYRLGARMKAEGKTCTW